MLGIGPHCSFFFSDCSCTLALCFPNAASGCQNVINVMLYVNDTDMESREGFSVRAESRASYLLGRFWQPEARLVW